MERKVTSSKLDPEIAEFVAWLSKQGDGGHGITRSKVINRMARFVRDLYIVGQCAIDATTVQVLLRQSGLPQQKEAEEGLGLSASSGTQPYQAQFRFFSRPGRAVSGRAYRPPFLGERIRLLFSPQSSTQRAA